MLHRLCQYCCPVCSPPGFILFLSRLCQCCRPVCCPPRVILFLSGLIFGHSLVQYRVTRIMITYLSDHWKLGATLRNTVIVVSAQDGLTSVLMIFTAYITDAYIGRFNAILYTTIAFIGGLLLLWFANPTSNAGVYMVMMVLIAIGHAGREPPLKAFLADHTKRINNSFNYNYDTLEARITIWWSVPYLIGVILATFFMGKLSWEKTFAISTIVMVVAFLLFLLGTPTYQPKRVTGSILTIVYCVFKNAIARRSIVYSYDPGDYYKNDNGDKLPLMPQILFFNWIDKAAIKGDTSSLNVEVQEEKGKLYTVTQVKEVKSLLTMIPMWVSFLMYCLVKATGNTLFFEQTSSLNDRIGNHDFKFPVPLLYVCQEVFKQVASYVCNSSIKKWFKKKMFLAMKARIGTGLACSCLCCVVARLVEVKRLDKVTKEEFIDVENKIVGMSILWLLPQFCLLGLTQGFGEAGLLKFFYYQVAESIKEYGPPFNEFVLGIGKFMSIFWVLTFKDWIGNNINVSRLDNYYGILAVCSIGNLFFIYGSILRYFYKYAKGEDVSFADDVEQLVGEIEQVTTN